MIMFYGALMWILGILTGILLEMRYSSKRKILKECLEAMEKAQENYGYDDSICEILDPCINKIYQELDYCDDD